MVSCELNIEAIFKRLNGPHNIARLLTEAGAPTTYQAVKLWGRSGVIPMAKWLKLKAIATERRIHLSLDDFIITTRS